MDIRNQTKRPLRVPLPGGKRLHIGPGGTGQIAPKAAEHPPVKKLIDAGQLEILEDGRSQGKRDSAHGPGSDPSQSGPPSGGVRHTGDR